MKNRHKGELAVPPKLIADPGATELLRIFVGSDGRPHVNVLHEALALEDWGRMLADMAKHIAYAHELSGKGNRHISMMRISSGLDFSWGTSFDHIIGRLN